MNKQEQIEEMAFDMSASLVYFNGEPKIINWQKTLENMHKKGYRRQEEVAREIFEELYTLIMPLVESQNKIAENTGDILWGHKAYGLETALLALKGIIRKYGVK